MTFKDRSLKKSNCGINKHVGTIRCHLATLVHLFTTMENFSKTMMKLKKGEEILRIV